MKLKTIKEALTALGEDEQQEISIFLQQMIDARFKKDKIFQLLQHEDISMVQTGLALVDTIGTAAKHHLLYPLLIINYELILRQDLQQFSHAEFIKMWLLADIFENSSSLAQSRQRLGLKENSTPILLRFPKTTRLQQLPDNIESIFRWTRIQDNNICWSIQSFQQSIIQVLPNHPLLLQEYLSFADRNIRNGAWQINDLSLSLRFNQSTCFDFSHWQGMISCNIDTQDINTVLSMPSSLRFLHIRTKLPLSACLPRLARYSLFRGLPVVQMYCIIYQYKRIKRQNLTHLDSYIQHWLQTPNAQQITRIFALGVDQCPTLQSLPNLQEAYLAFSNISSIPSLPHKLKRLYIMGTRLTQPPTNVRILHLDIVQYQKWKEELERDLTIEELHIYVDQNHSDEVIDSKKTVILYGNQENDAHLLHIEKIPQDDKILRMLNRSFCRKLGMPMRRRTQHIRVPVTALHEKYTQELIQKLYLAGVALWINP